MTELSKYLDELKTLRYMHRRKAKETDKMYTREIRSVQTRLKKHKGLSLSDGKMTKPAYGALSPMAKPQPAPTPVKVLPRGQNSRGSFASRPSSACDLAKPKPPQK